MCVTCAASGRCVTVCDYWVRVPGCYTVAPVIKNLDPCGITLLLLWLCLPAACVCARLPDSRGVPGYAAIPAVRCNDFFFFNCVCVGVCNNN